MPFNFNGIGTTFYGARDYRSDGSYVTSEFVILFWVPVIPLRSVRVFSVEDDSDFVVYSSRSYRYMDVPLDRRQAGFVLGWFLALGALIGMGIAGLAWSSEAMLITAAALIVVHCCIPWLLRKIAFRRMLRECERQNSAAA